MAKSATMFAAQIAKVGIMAPFRLYDNGFRQITSSTRPINVPADLKGFKIRVPPSPILTSLFKSLDAGPAPINFNEVYSALQTKVVEGQENPLPIIYTTRLYEVQKYCSMTGHTWDGYWILANRRAWEKLPEDLRAVVTREVDRSAMDQREDIAKLSVSLRDDLTAKGLTVQRRGSRGLPGGARQDDLLQGLESQVRRRSLEHAREVHRRAGLNAMKVENIATADVAAGLAPGQRHWAAPHRHGPAVSCRDPGGAPGRRRDRRFFSRA